MAIIEPTANTLQLVESKLFHLIADATKIIGNNLNIQTALFLPIIPNGIKIDTEKDLYKYFNFTKEEVDEIEKYNIPKYTNCELSCKGKSALNNDSMRCTRKKSRVDKNNKNNNKNNKNKTKKIKK